MYVYLGRVGGGYEWVIATGNHIYIYRRGSDTKWKAKLKQKIPIWRASYQLRLELLKLAKAAAPSFFEGIKELIFKSPLGKKFVEVYKEELEALGLLDDDG